MTLVGSLSAPNTFGFKNRIINGGMVIDQRATSLTGGGYSVDRWQYAPSVTLKMTVAQSSTAPSGFINSLLATSSSAYSITSTDYFTLIQYIEGLNCADLAWGTSSAATVTLSFWVRSSLTGTFGGCLRNSASDRSYPFTYTISSANTWEQKSVTIAGDTSGTWLTTNGIGIRVIFGMGVGSTYSGTAGAWSSNSYLSATGATSVVGTNGATFYITGVQLEKGSTATSFDFRDYGRELILCQRYYAQAKTGGYPGAFAFIAMTTNGTIGSLSFPVTMRTGPTFTISYGGVTNNMVNISTGVAVSATPAQTWWTKDGVLGVQANSPFTASIGYGFDYTASAEL
jgi:hypothetical protein